MWAKHLNKKKKSKTLTRQQSQVTCHDFVDFCHQHKHRFREQNAKLNTLIRQKTAMPITRELEQPSSNLM